MNNGEQILRTLLEATGRNEKEIEEFLINNPILDLGVKDKKN